MSTWWNRYPINTFISAWEIHFYYIQSIPCFILNPTIVDYSSNGAAINNDLNWSLYKEFQPYKNYTINFMGFSAHFGIFRLFWPLLYYIASIKLLSTLFWCILFKVLTIVLNIILGYASFENCHWKWLPAKPSVQDHHSSSGYFKQCCGLGFSEKNSSPRKI